MLASGDSECVLLYDDSRKVRNPKNGLSCSSSFSCVIRRIFPFTYFDKRIDGLTEYLHVLPEVLFPGKT